MNSINIVSTYHSNRWIFQKPLYYELNVIKELHLPIYIWYQIKLRCKINVIVSTVFNMVCWSRSRDVWGTRWALSRLCQSVGQPPLRVSDSPCSAWRSTQQLTTFIRTGMLDLFLRLWFFLDPFPYCEDFGTFVVYVKVSIKITLVSMILMKDADMKGNTNKLAHYRILYSSCLYRSSYRYLHIVLNQKFS